MSARERVMTIRLMEKLHLHPARAKALGIEICVAYPSKETDKRKKRKQIWD